jgi:hypothetical protein
MWRVLETRLNTTQTAGAIPNSTIQMRSGDTCLRGNEHEDYAFRVTNPH